MVLERKDKMLLIMKKLKILVFIFIMWPLLCSSEELNKIVAKVNNSVITLKDVEEYAKSISLDKTYPHDYKKIVERLIEEKLIIQLAKKDNIKIDEDWVKDRLERLISAYNSYEEFERYLAKEGLSVAKVKERIRESFLIRKAVEKYINSKIEISPIEITNYYNEHIEDFISPLRYICWIAKSNKKDFLEKLADAIKKDGINKVVDGNKEIFFKIDSEGEGLKDEVREVIEKMKDSEFEIKEIEGAYYLIYLVKVIPEHKRFLNEVKEEIYKKLWEEKFSKKFSQWVEKLKKQFMVKIYTP